MTDVKTELATLEEHDNAMRRAIERRAYALYESDGFTDGHDREHWLRAERELTIQGIPCSIEDGALSVSLAVEDYPVSTLVISVAARSLLIFGFRDAPDNDGEDIDGECLRIIPLPVEIDPGQVVCDLDQGHISLKLPLVADSVALSKAAAAH